MSDRVRRLCVVLWCLDGLSNLGLVVCEFVVGKWWQVAFRLGMVIVAFAVMAAFAAGWVVVARPSQPPTVQRWRPSDHE